MAARTRAFRLLPTLVALAALFAGCGGTAEKAPSVSLWTMQLKPTFSEFIGGLIADWERAHPGVRVEWVDLPANEIEQKTLTAAAGGNPPDLVNLNPAFANKLANAGALTPITLPKAEHDAYFASAFEANTVKGQVIGLPWYLSTSVSVVNTALWRKAGLDPVDLPRTYRELAPLARRIRERTGAYGFMPPLGDRGKFMELLAADGVPLISEDRKSPAFLTPEGVATLTFWAGLVKDGTLPREALTQGHREAIDRFQGGQTALLPAGPQFLRIIQENSPALYDQLTVAPPVTGTSGRVGVGVMNLVIPLASDAPALALDLARHLTSGPNQLAFAKLVPILPSVKAAAGDPYFRRTGDMVDRARAIAAEQLPRAQLLVPPLPRQSELAKSLDDALSRAALGTQTPEAALAQAAAEWRLLLSAI